MLQQSVQVETRTAIAAKVLSPGVSDLRRNPARQPTIEGTAQEQEAGGCLSNVWLASLHAWGAVSDRFHILVGGQCG